MSGGGLRGLLAELYEWALDACHQGTGQPFQEHPRWHMCISTWEQADELLPRIAAALAADAPADEVEPWVEVAERSARARVAALPAGVRDAALRSGTRTTLRNRTVAAPAEPGATEGRRAPTPFDCFQAGMFDGVTRGGDRPAAEYDPNEVRQAFSGWLEEWSAEHAALSPRPAPVSAAPTEGER